MNGVGRSRGDLERCGVGCDRVGKRSGGIGHGDVYGRTVNLASGSLLTQPADVLASEETTRRVSKAGVRFESGAGSESLQTSAEPGQHQVKEPTVTGGYSTVLDGTRVTVRRCPDLRSRWSGVSRAFLDTEEVGGSNPPAPTI